MGRLHLISISLKTGAGRGLQSPQRGCSLAGAGVRLTRAEPEQGPRAPATSTAASPASGALPRSAKLTQVAPGHPLPGAARPVLSGLRADQVTAPLSPPVPPTSNPQSLCPGFFLSSPSPQLVFALGLARLLEPKRPGHGDPDLPSFALRPRRGRHRRLASGRGLEAGREV